MRTSLLFLLLIPLTSAQRPRRCPSGTFLSGDAACEPCPAGTYRVAEGFGSPADSPCLPCPKGKFSPGVGATGPDLCQWCPPDTFADKRGTPICKKCPKGTASRYGATRCLRCGPGTKVAFNSRSCIPCKSGTYSSGESNLRCRKCPYANISPPGAKSKDECKPCPPGKGEDSGACTPCPSGYFKPSFDGRCLICPPGYWSVRRARKCTPCPPGEFRARFTSGCQQCPRGSTTFGVGNSACRVSGEKCDISYFEDETGDCRRCPTGYRVNLVEKKCEKCPSGSVSAGGVNTLCVQCKNGQMPDADKTKCVCPKGSEENSTGGCSLCRPGLASEYDGARCSKCFKGFFARGSGSTSCKRCPFGRFSSEEASARCKKCLEGFVPFFVRSRGPPPAFDCVSSSTHCAAGFVRRVRLEGGVFRSFTCRRVLCTSDTPTEDIGETCAPCPPGTFADIRSNVCRSCSKREVGPGGLATKCESCPDGLFPNPFDRSKCTCRQKFVMKNGKCRPCPRGTRFIGEDQKCVPCPAGTFGEQRPIDEPFVLDGTCEECPIDTFSTGGAPECQECPEGTISNLRPGGTKCIPLQV